MYAVVVRPKLYSTEVAQDSFDRTVIGYLISGSASSLACLVKELIPTHLDLHFCDEGHELISPRTQERVKCSGFVHLFNIQKISFTTPAPYAPA
jgi:hypothetical protein